MVLLSWTSTTSAKTGFESNPKAIQLMPLSVLLNTPPVRAPAYNVAGVCGSTARPRTGPGLPGLAIQLSPRSVLFSTPMGVATIDRGRAVRINNQILSGRNKRRPHPIGAGVYSFE